MLVSDVCLQQEWPLPCPPLEVDFQVEDVLLANDFVIHSWMGSPCPAPHPSPLVCVGVGGDHVFTPQHPHRLPELLSAWGVCAQDGRAWGTEGL